jgi:SAM-dependent methyltransferase
MTDAVTPETEHEITLKDQEYAAMQEVFQPPPSGWRSEYVDRIEIPPHLDALEPLNGSRVLELACGDGRFTMLMAQLGAEVLAVDFALAALRKMTENLPSGVAPTTYKVVPRRPAGSLVAHVGLVQADASHFHVAPRSFDRALSATPLDYRDERMRMYCAISEALTDAGRFVGGFDHDDLYRKLFGLPLISRYTPGGVLIDHLDTPTLRREVAPYFSQMRFRPIRAHLPFMKRLSMKAAASVALAADKIPGLRQCGGILLVLAEGPIRLPVEGARRPGSAVAKSLYRWFKRRKGERPEWDPGVEV